LRYLGGKAKVATKLTTFLESVRKPNQMFVDGMVGGCSIVRKMTGERIAADSCPYLITFLKCLQDGWTPPETISEQRYYEIRKMYKEGYHAPVIGFAAYFCSFGGKFWGGFARDPKTARDFANEAYRDALKLMEEIREVKLFCCDYSDLLINIIPEKSLVYFDIPYEGTTGYKNKFYNSLFWQVIRIFSNKHDIYISEYQAPEDFECVWSLKRKTELNTKNGKDTRIEKLFKYKG